MYSALAWLMWHDQQILAGMKPAERDAEHRRRKMARITNKDTNMSTRLQRRRSELRRKWLFYVFIFAAGMIVMPIFIGTVSALWHWALS